MASKPKKTGGHKLFGVSLSKLSKQSLEHGIPPVCWEILRNLSNKERITTEGMFRVSAAQPEVTALVVRLEAGEPLQWDQHSPHLLATLLKKWLIDLPEPVFPFGLYEPLIAAMDDPAPLPRFIKLLKRMPSVNKALAEALLLFLSRVGSCEVNQMTPQNLAVVFAPILLQPPFHKNGLLLLHANKGILVIRFLIDHVFELYPQAASAQRILSVARLDSHPEGSLSSLAVGPADLFSPFSSSSSSFFSPSAASLPDLRGHPSPLPSSPPSLLEAQDDGMKAAALRSTLDGAIVQLLEKLDDISQEIQVSSSVADAAQLSKKVRAAFLLLFDDAVAARVSSPSSSTAKLFARDDLEV